MADMTLKQAGEACQNLAKQYASVLALAKACENAGDLEARIASYEKVSAEAKAELEGVQAEVTAAQAALFDAEQAVEKSKERAKTILDEAQKTKDLWEEQASAAYSDRVKRAEEVIEEAKAKAAAELEVVKAERDAVIAARDEAKADLENLKAEIKRVIEQNTSEV